MKIGHTHAELQQLVTALAGENLNLRRAIGARTRDASGERTDVDNLPVEEVIDILEQERMLHDSNFEHQRLRAILSVLAYREGDEGIAIPQLEIQAMPDGQLTQAYDINEDCFLLKYIAEPTNVQ